LATLTQKKTSWCVSEGRDATAIIGMVMVQRKVMVIARY